MPYRTINFQKIGEVLVIYIMDNVDDQEKMIRLSDELDELCSEIIRHEQTRVIFLTDSGKESFSNLIEENLIRPDAVVNEFCSLAKPIGKLDQPVIAGIRGDAVGQGLELALACDIRIASDTSRFGLPQIKAGHIPRDGGTQRLSRLVGRGKALEMILTGEVVDAQEALRIGLVNKVVPNKDLMEVTMKMAQEMASKGPIALRYTKEAIYKGMDMTLEQGLRLEADLYLLIHTSKDRTEGIQAFQEKRKPKFEGK
jgi:enoyl-CoA hydratase/carnithine racemase